MLMDSSSKQKGGFIPAFFVVTVVYTYVIVNARK